MLVDWERWDAAIQGCREIGEGMAQLDLRALRGNAKSTSQRALQKRWGWSRRRVMDFIKLHPTSDPLAPDPKPRWSGPLGREANQGEVPSMAAPVHDIKGGQILTPPGSGADQRSVSPMRAPSPSFSVLVDEVVEVLREALDEAEEPPTRRQAHARVPELHAKLRSLPGLEQVTTRDVRIALDRLLEAA